MSRSRFTKAIVQLAPQSVTMEAHRDAGHESLRFSVLGHEVRLIHPRFVRPFVESA